MPIGEVWKVVPERPHARLQLDYSRKNGEIDLGTSQPTSHWGMLMILGHVYSRNGSLHYTKETVSEGKNKP